MSLEPSRKDDVLLYEDDEEDEQMNLFYKDDAVLPDVEMLYEPGDTRQEKTDKVVAAAQRMLCICLKLDVRT